MKLFLIPAMALAMLAATPNRAFAQYATQTIPSVPLYTFENSLGINLHIDYEDGLYADSNISNVIADLQFLGITHVRQGTPLPDYGSDTMAAYYTMLGAGFKFNMVNTCSSTEASQFNDMAALQAEYPGSITSVEGTNEVNNQPCSSVSSAASEAAAVTFQQQLYQNVHNASAFDGVPVLYFTGLISTNTLSGMADAMNIHPYATNGSQPYPTIAANISDYYTGSALNNPLYITETGYQTNYGGATSNYVDETAQAELDVNSYFDGALLGSKGTFLYQLLQAYPQGSPPAPDYAYGIFRYEDNSPMPAALAIHRLTTNLPPDVPSAQATVTGILLDQNVQPYSGTEKSLALTASNGDVYVCSWNEQPVWNPNTNTRIDNPVQGMYVQLPGKWSSVSYFAVDGTGDPQYTNQGFSTGLGPAGTYQGQPYYAAWMVASPSCVVFHK